VGIFFGAATRQRLAEPVQFTETLGLAGSFVVWSIFGARFVGEVLTRGLAARPIIYAILSLTVIRMVPVAVALTGTGLRRATAAGDRHLDHPGFGGAAWHLGLAAGCPVRGIDRPGGHHPRDHPGS
jgi:hypothetical protein